MLHLTVILVDFLTGLIMAGAWALVAAVGSLAAGAFGVFAVWRIWTRKRG